MNEANPVKIYWEIAVAKCALSAFIAGAVVFMAATQVIKWESLSGFEKSMIFLASIVAMAKDVLSFASMTLAELQKSRSLDIPRGQEVVESTQTTTSRVEKTPEGTTVQNTEAKTLVTTDQDSREG